MDRAYTHIYMYIRLGRDRAKHMITYDRRCRIRIHKRRHIHDNTRVYSIYNVETLVWPWIASFFYVFFFFVL